MEICKYKEYKLTKKTFHSLIELTVAPGAREYWRGLRSSTEGPLRGR